MGRDLRLISKVHAIEHSQKRSVTVSVPTVNTKNSLGQGSLSVSPMSLMSATILTISTCWELSVLANFPVPGNLLCQ